MGLRAVAVEITSQRSGSEGRWRVGVGSCRCGAIDSWIGGGDITNGVRTVVVIITALIEGGVGKRYEVACSRLRNWGRVDGVSW